MSADETMRVVRRAPMTLGEITAERRIDRLCMIAGGLAGRLSPLEAVKQATHILDLIEQQERP